MWIKALSQQFNQLSIGNFVVCLFLYKNTFNRCFICPGEMAQ